MDSAVLIYTLKDRDDVRLLSFDYGQRHRKELEYAVNLADDLNLKHDIVDLKSVGKLLGGSALTDESIEVPHGHYAEENMKVTVVPNRNQIMLSIAAGVAVAEKRERIVIGVHAGDHDVYPDCRPEF